MQGTLHGYFQSSVLRQYPRSVLEDSLFGVSAGLLQVLRRNNPEANVSGPHRVAMEAWWEYRKALRGKKWLPWSVLRSDDRHGHHRTKAE
jgi:hypothetical protein